MKSLNFTHKRDKIWNGEKTQTIRTLFFPTFEENEIVLLKFKKKPLFEVQITEIYIKKIKDLTKEEAKRDGFNSKEELIKALLEINHLKSNNRFCAVIKFKRVSERLDKFLTKGSEKYEV